MKIETNAASLSTWSGDLMAIGFCQSDQAIVLDGAYASLDQRLGGTVQEVIQEADFQGKTGTSLIVRLASHSPIRKLMLIGLGEADQLDGETLRRTASAVARSARREKVNTLALHFPQWQSPPQTTQAIAEGIYLALHQDHRFKSDPEAAKLAEYPQTVQLMGMENQITSLNQADIISRGVILARELVNAPPNIVSSLTLAETARNLAATYGMDLKILEEADCRALGMGAFLGVAQASDIPPKFIHLTYRPSTPARQKIAIIGKGLTFDSGGLNIKGAGSGIEMMKTDMSGAAAVFGAAQAIAQLHPKIEVHFIVAATENMISGNALHPGDILTASNGKTIEVNNTDAEGRLTLADALVYTEKLSVDAIVDLATLTGACIVALGETIAGIWSNDDLLASQLTAAAATTGEKLWAMPLEEKYFDGLKSIVADMKNTGPRPGGAITAALFLKQFIDSTAWAHLDVAGPVWTDKEDGYNNPGGTGFAVRTLVQWVLDRSMDQA